MRRIVYTLLDFLLIVGAIAVVVTIDGGKWITGQVTYAPADMRWDESYAILAAYNAAESSIVQTSTTESATPESNTQKASPCRTIYLSMIAEWDVAYLMLAEYNNTGSFPDVAGSLVPAC